MVEHLLRPASIHARNQLENHPAVAANRTATQVRLAIEIARLVEDQASKGIKSVARPYPSQYVSPFTMRDGAEVTLRPIRPEDEPLMCKFHETLSDRIVYRRYFSSLSLSSRVAHERLVRICFVDYDRVMALVVDHKDEATGEHRILGVGRLIKLHTKNKAEIAILVSDQYQKQGLGMELLRRTVQIARDEKLSSVSAEMLRDNFAVQRIFKKVGFRVRLVADSSSISAVLDL
jgi:acetyltransferase